MGSLLGAILAVGANLNDFGIALVAAIPATLTVWFTARGQNKKLDKVENAVATSNGKTAGSYIEDVYHRFEQLEVDQTILLRQLLDLGDRSDRRFAHIDGRLRRLEELRNGLNLD